MKTIIKTIVAITIVALISFDAYAQKDIPQSVTTAFSTKYPQVQLKKWKEEKNVYVALFAMNDKKYQACYSKDGNWLNTERKIKTTSDLPPEVRSYFNRGTYASWKIDEMKRVRTPSQNIYQVYVDNHGGSPAMYEDVVSAEDRLLSFDDSGKLIDAKEQ